jgi:hypothetical protein
MPNKDDIARPERTWPWGCQVQDPTHRGMGHSGDRNHPPTDPLATCVTYIEDWDLAHPDNPLCNPPRRNIWVYCVPELPELLAEGRAALGGRQPELPPC